MRILSIDPGTKQSAWVFFDCDTYRIIEHDKEDNERLCRSFDSQHDSKRYQHVVVEMVASYGKPVGQEVFDTCVWIGRFRQAAERWVGTTCILRKDVKMHLCDTIRGVNDAVIRQRLIDLFGPGKEKAIGKKAAPGPLYGIKADCWAALALAVTFAETHAVTFAETHKAAEEAKR